MILRLFFASVVCGIVCCTTENYLNRVKDPGYVLKASFNPNCPRGFVPTVKLLPHEDDCSLFYICQNGQAILQKCPSNLHFNPSKSVCDFPGNTNCEKDDSPNPRGRINDQQLVVRCPKTPAHVLISHPTDCGKFFTCDAGVAHVTSCQKGLHFNEELQTCDYPENSGCHNGNTQVPKENMGDDKSSTLCPSEKTKFPILKPHSSDCGKFYICDGGIPHLKVCQSGLHFNPKTQTCDFPRNAGCDSSIVKEKPRENTIGEDSYLECPAVNPGNPVFLPHKTDCGKFYICDGGVPHLKVCQSGLHFNTRIHACDYPTNARCATDLSKKNPGAKGRLGDNSVCPNSDITVFIPHPDDCTKFIACDKGQAHTQKCPSGLHFSPNLQACDYPKQAQCENVSKEVVLRSPGVSSPFCPTIEGKSPVFYRHPTNCSVYFMCSNGFAYKFECPARLHFNLRQKVCDYEWIARCPSGKKDIE